MANDVCNGCNKNIGSNEIGVANCTLCKAIGHISCENKVSTRTTTNDFKSTTNLRYFCQKCIPLIDSLMPLTDMVKLVSELNEKVLRLETAFSQQNYPLVQSQFGQMSYASALKSDDKSDEKKIIIKSKDKKDDMKSVREKLAQNVNPITNEISDFAPLPNHSFVLKSKSKETAKLVLNIRENLGDNYEVEIVENKRPKIKIVGFQNDANMSHEDIIHALKIQNGKFFSSEDEIKMVKEIKGRMNENVSSYVVSVDRKIHKKLIDQKFVFIGYVRCRVYDATIVPRCYKCSRLGHFDNNNQCENEPCCAKCCGPHKVSECNNNGVKCINCVESNEKFQTKFDINHAAFDRKCPTMMKRLAVMRKSNGK